MSQGYSLRAIAAESGKSPPSVLRIGRLVLAAAYTGERWGISREMGALLVRALRGEAVSPATARLLHTDPRAVLDGAEALAELARRRIAENGGERAA